MRICVRFTPTDFLKSTFCFPPGSTDGVWVKHCIKDKYDYFYNLETEQGTWEEPEGFEQNSGHLSKEEIQVLPLDYKALTFPIDWADFIFTLTVVRFVYTWIASKETIFMLLWGILGFSLRMWWPVWLLSITGNSYGWPMSALWPSCRQESEVTWSGRSTSREWSICISKNHMS